jgi:hypothetical protein
MTMEDQMQRQRFERKYFINEQQALQVREFVKNYLVLDEFSVGKENYCYPVHSVYLDSDDLLTYWATVHCEKTRFKLRVRFYDDKPDSPLFFEIKRRENECILKQRAMVHRCHGEHLLAGHVPGPQHLVKNKPSHLAALQRFSYLMHRIHARPMEHVAYMREAWVSAQNNSVRVTVDRQVRGEPYHKSVFTTRMQNPIYPFGKNHVLEIKFTDRFPDWLGIMVRQFDFLQTGAPKYCGSVMLSGEEKCPWRDADSVQQKLAHLRNI